jgi:DNA-binding transcriptional ArsR family regulator
VIKFLAGCGTDGATVGEIEAAVGISQSNLSNHLKLMRIAKVVTAKQKNNHMFYSIKEPLVFMLIASLE